MNEHPEPQYLKPESRSPGPERAESAESSAERAAGSTADLVRRSSTEIARAGKDVAGLRAGPARERLEKRQGALAGRLSGFRKKAMAILAGLTLAIGAVRGGSETPEEPSGSADRSASARELVDAFAAAREQMEETEPDEEEAEAPERPSNGDPFDTTGGASQAAFEKELAEREAEAKTAFEQEQAAQAEERAAIRSYADVVTDDWITADADSFVDAMHAHSLDAQHEMFRKKAKDIGANEEDFIRESDEAVLAKFAAVRKKMIEAPDTLTPAEQKIAEDFRKQDRESAQAAETPQEDAPDAPEKS